MFYFIHEWSGDFPILNIFRYLTFRAAFGAITGFLFSILVILSLSGLARISAGSAPLQWLAECLNLLAHGSFALAVWRLRQVLTGDKPNE